MPIYDIGLTRKIVQVQTTSLSVEAATEEEAREIAYDRAEEFSDDMWEPADDSGEPADIDIDYCEEH